MKPPPRFYYFATSRRTQKDMAKKEKDPIMQPGVEEQRLLDSIMNDSVDYVEVRGKRWPVKWMKNGQLRKISSIMLEKNPLEGQKPKEENYESDPDAYASAMRDYERRMLVHHKEEKVLCKCAAVMRLRGFLKSKLFYAILWRWYYYVKEYGSEELLPFITECKKKIPAETYYASIILLTGMKDTMMAMTREEVSRFQAAQLMAQLGQSEKTTRV